MQPLCSDRNIKSFFAILERKSETGKTIFQLLSSHYNIYKHSAIPGVSVGIGLKLSQQISDIFFDVHFLNLFAGDSQTRRTF